MSADGVLPLRPLTLGELLDAGIALLRRHAGVLLLSGAVLAILEQAALYPLRLIALHHVNSFWLPTYDTLATLWLLIAIGLGTESVIITLLGGLAGQAARDALIDGGHGLYRQVGRRLGWLVPLALVLGVGATLGAAAGLLPWIAWYGLTGLAAPALIVDQRVPLQSPPAGTRFTAVPLPRTDVPPRPVGMFAALGRSIALVGRGRLRPAGIRLLGYLAWYMIRLALGLGGVAALNLVVYTRSTGWWWLITMAVWAMVNAVAYPALACLDAVLHLENRMRVEGLDIALSRALRRGAPTAPILAVPR
ncbi:MAG: hypothetical protein V7603_6179 [Micromonosporaceae bacterium]